MAGRLVAQTAAAGRCTALLDRLVAQTAAAARLGVGFSEQTWPNRVMGGTLERRLGDAARVTALLL